MEKKKYELIQGSEITICGGTKLMQIRALRDFGDVKKGDVGGYIESKENLSHEGNCWVYNDARVYDNARVYGNACVYGDASVYDDAIVYGWAEVYGLAMVYGDAEVYGNVSLGGDAEVKSVEDYVVFKNWWSSGRYFTWTRSNNMWKVGCFYGTGEELIKKAYRDSDISGREYERVVKYVEEILRDGREE